MTSTEEHNASRQRRVLSLHSSEEMFATFASFSVTVAWDCLVFLVCLCAFNFLRQWSETKKFYAPKRYVDDAKYKRPKELPEGRGFAWVRMLLQYTEEDVIKIAGYDAAVYLRIFSFGIKLFLILSIFNLIVVLPVNLTDDRVQTLQRLEKGELSKEEADRIRSEDVATNTTASLRDVEDGDEVEYEIGQFDRVSMTNVDPGSNRLWAHLLSIYFITFYTLKLLWTYHRDAIDLRIRFLATTENGAESHTVLVTDVPGLQFGSPLDRLMQSAIFKYLPSSVRNRVEESIELLFSVATEGISQVNNVTARVARNLNEQLQGSSRSKLKSTKNKRLLGRNIDRAVLNLRLKETDVKWINPEDLTDMDPVKWVTSQLTEGTSLETVVRRQFDQVYPKGLVKCANIVHDTVAVERLMEEYDRTMIRLEDRIDHYKTKIKEGMIDIEPLKRRVVPMVEGKWAVDRYGQKPIRLDLLGFYSDKLNHLKEKIVEEREKLSNAKVPSAFVTFKTRWAQAVSSTSFHHHFMTFWNVQAAPHPDEVVWENLKYRGWERAARKALIWVEFIMLCLFFLAPVTFVQGLIQMDRLEDFPIVGPIVTFPLINGILKAIVPNLALKLFLFFLPELLKKMNRYQGLISLSEIDFEVVKKYFIFQTVAVFFFTFITSSIMNQIQELVNEPSKLREILGVSAPQASNFFLSYILYSGLFESGIGFLNPINLMFLWIQSRFAGTERAKARIWKDQTIEYGPEVPSHTFTILLGLAFSVINPIILPVALIYFLAMKLTQTYNMLYIYSEEYQSGGKLWEYVFEHIVAGLIIMQAMMMGLFAIKKFVYSALLIPLPFVTVIFRWMMHRLYDKPLKILSLRAAHDLDVADDEIVQLEMKKEEGEEEECHTQYKHPVFLIDWEELDDVLTEAKGVSDVMEGLQKMFDKGRWVPPDSCKI